MMMFISLSYMSYMSCYLAKTPVRPGPERYPASRYANWTAHAGAIQQIMLPLASSARVPCTACAPITRSTVRLFAVARLALIWAALLFAAVAGKRRLAKVFVAVSSFVCNHSRWAGGLFDARAVVEKVPARTTVAFDKRVLVGRAKRGVRTLLFRAVSVAPMAVLFNGPAILLSVAAGAFCASFVELRALASQPVLAHVHSVYRGRKCYPAATFAHLFSSRSDPRRIASRQGWLATRHLAQATFGDACTPAGSLSYWKEACGNAARFCAAHAVEQVVAVAALEAGAGILVANVAVAAFGTAIAWRVRDVGRGV